MATTSNPIDPVSLNSTQKEAFSSAVKYILTEWPSLNFAIENGMGGTDAKQKQAWMCEHIADVIQKDTDIDLVDYLSEIVNQEFDTLIEDGSLEYNSSWITKFYKDCLQGREQDVVNSIRQAAAKKQSLGNMRIPAPQKLSQDEDDDDIEGDADDFDSDDDEGYD